MSQLKKGAIISYLNIFLANIAGLLLTPFIIRSLGNAEYGLYLLIGSFVSYIALMDLGLNNTIIRFVAKYRAEKDLEGEENFLATTMLIYLFISLIIVVLGIILYFNLDHLFGKTLSPEEMSKAKIMFVILIFNMAITLPGGAFAAISSGYEKFVFPRFATTIRYIVRSVLIVIILFFRGGAISIVVLDTIMNISFVMVNAFFVIQKLGVRFKFHSFEKRFIKEIFSYSIWIFVFALVQKFQWQSGQVILGMNANTRIVAVFGVGVMLGTYYGAFASAITSVLLPKATQMVVNETSGEEITQLMSKIGRLTFMVLNVILAGFALFGNEFVFLWVGPAYKDAWVVSLLIMIVLTVPLTQSFGNSILEASNKIKIKAILNLVTIVIGVSIGFILTKYYGIYGMISSIVSAIFINSIITSLYFKKTFNFKILFFFKNTFSKGPLVLVIILFLGLGLNYWLPYYSWGNLIFKLTVLTVLYLIVLYAIELKKKEKGKLIATFKRIKNGEMKKNVLADPWF